jgi:hypothetical protein
MPCFLHSPDDRFGILTCDYHKSDMTLLSREGKTSLRKLANVFKDRPDDLDKLKPTTDRCAQVPALPLQSLSRQQ